MENNWGSGFRLNVGLIPDTSFTGGFEIVFQLNSQADLTVSDNEQQVVLLMCLAATRIA